LERKAGVVAMGGEKKPATGKCSRCGDYKGALVDEEKGIYLCVKCFADYTAHANIGDEEKKRICKTCQHYHTIASTLDASEGTVDLTEQECGGCVNFSNWTPAKRCDI
jgi:NMD protein affecting ribosome stability and mRNA decay